MSRGPVVPLHNNASYKLLQACLKLRCLRNSLEDKAALKLSFHPDFGLFSVRDKSSVEYLSATTDRLRMNAYLMSRVHRSMRPVPIFHENIADVHSAEHVVRAGISEPARPRLPAQGNQKKAISKTGDKPGCVRCTIM